MEQEQIVGAFQAKTYFAELLRKVEGGATVTITKNGHDAAIMQSPATKQNAESIAAWKKLTAISKEISSQTEVPPATVSEIMEWKNDGRK